MDELEDLEVQELEAAVRLKDEIVEMQDAQGWKQLLILMQVELEDLNDNINNDKILGDELISCVFKRRGILFVVDTVERIIQEGLEAQEDLSSKQ